MRVHVAKHARGTDLDIYTFRCEACVPIRVMQILSNLRDCCWTLIALATFACQSWMTQDKQTKPYKTSLAAMLGLVDGLQAWLAQSSFLVHHSPAWEERASFDDGPPWTHAGNCLSEALRSRVVTHGPFFTDISTLYN